MRPADDRRLRCAGDLTSALLLLPVPSVGRRPHRAAGASASKGGQLCCGCSRQLQAFQCTAAQAAPRRSGTDAIIALGTTALGWPSPHTPCPCHAKSHPTGVPCQSTLPIHPPGKFSPYTARSAPSQFSPVPLLCPPSLSTAPLRPRSVFPFLFLPLPPLAPRVLLCLFSLCARAACDFKKHPFACLLPSFYRPCCWSLPAVFFDTLDNTPLASRPSRSSRVKYPAGREYAPCLLPAVFESEFCFVPAAIGLLVFSLPLVPCVEPSPCRPRPGPLRDADLDLDVNLDVDLDVGLDSGWRIWDGLCDFGRENGGMVGSGVWLRCWVWIGRR